MCSDDLIEVLTNKGDGIYISENNKPEINNTYTIDIKSSNLASIKATSMIPNNFSIAADTNISENENFIEYLIDISDNEENFYTIEEIIKIYYDNGDSSVYSHYLSTKDLNIDRPIEDLEPEYYAFCFYLRDEIFNGLTYNFKLRSYFDLYQNHVIKYISQLKVCSITEEFLLYLLSIEKYENSNDDPFSTPIKVYSNFENGLGIFTGVNQQIMEYDLTNEVLY